MRKINFFILALFFCLFLPAFIAPQSEANSRKNSINSVLSSAIVIDNTAKDGLSAPAAKMVNMLSANGYRVSAKSGITWKNKDEESINRLLAELQPASMGVIVFFGPTSKDSLNRLAPYGAKGSPAAEQFLHPDELLEKIKSKGSKNAVVAVFDPGKREEENRASSPSSTNNPVQLKAREKSLLIYGTATKNDPEGQLFSDTLLDNLRKIRLNLDTITQPVGTAFSADPTLVSWINDPFADSIWTGNPLGEADNYKPTKQRFYGLATWYGGKFHGRRTANGEIFDQNGMTAAHRTLPLGTVVEVTNPKNNQSVRVRINDRMGNRHALIDLSRGASRKIGLNGTGHVQMTILANGD